MTTNIEQLRALAERLDTGAERLWRSLNERDDLARMLWNAIKADAGEEISFSDCQRAVGGSIDAVEAVRQCVLGWRVHEVACAGMHSWRCRLFGPDEAWVRVDANTEHTARLRALVNALEIKAEAPQ
jgi:hypothetical protein